MDLIRDLLPTENERKLTDKEQAFERVAEEYTKIFGFIPQGLEFPEITIELLQKALDDDIEIQPFALKDDEVA